MRKAFLLRPDIVYLNHGSYGACPAVVFERYQAWQRELESEPVEFLGRRFGSLMRAARTDLADFVGADPEDIAFVHNATTAINTVAQSLTLQPADEILSTNLEYGALDRAWAAVCARTGSRYIRRPISLPVTDRADLVEEIWSGFNERTRVLYLSHITSATGFALPVKELIARAKDEGLVVVVDGAHAPGQIPLNLEDLGADFYTGNCHKWMMTPKGCAFLYARREAQEKLRTLIVSWGDVAESDSSFIREFEYQGTNDISAFLSVSAAIRFMRENSWDNVRTSCHELVNVYRAGMRGITGLPSLTPDTSEWYAQLSAHPMPPCDGPAFQRALFEEYSIEIPVMNGPNGEHYLRISVQGYNTRDDVDRLLGAVRALLPQFAEIAAS